MIAATKTGVRPARQGGFSLLELMAAVGIVAIFTAIALPSLVNTIRNNNRTTRSASLVSALDYARDEAIKQDATVIICAKSLTVTACDLTGYNWANGWLVYCLSAGATTGNVCTPSGSNQVALRTFPALSSGSTLKASFTGGAISFTSNGTTGTANSAVPLIFTFCDKQGSGNAAAVEVNTMGRVQAATKAGQDVSGAALTCP